jgi:peroxiredoxin
LPAFCSHAQRKTQKLLSDSSKEVARYLGRIKDNYCIMYLITTMQRSQCVTRADTPSKIQQKKNVTNVSYKRKTKTLLLVKIDLTCTYAYLN